jgi:hypothetical protein
MPDQPPAIGELVRSIDRIANVLDKLDAKVDNLDMKVDRWREELIEVRHKANTNTEKINRIEHLRERDAERNERRKWVVYGAAIAAALAFVSQLYFATVGAGI